MIAPMLRAQFFAVFCLSWLVAACAERAHLDAPGPVTVRVISDYAPGVEARLARTSFYAGDREAPSARLGLQERAIAVSDPLGAGLEIARFDAPRSGMHTVHVSLLDSRGDTVGARNVVFDAGATRTVTVVISAACRGVECPGPGAASATACQAGTCVDPRCSPEAPEFCPPALRCDEPSDCAGVASECAEAACVAGFCLDVPKANSCEDGEYCARERGCEPVDGTPDPDPTPDPRCGRVCTLAEAPCRYGYFECDGSTVVCRAFVTVPAGEVCGENAACDGEGVCVTSPIDAGVADASVADAGRDASIDAGRDGGGTITPADRVRFEVTTVRVTELGQNEVSFGIRLSREPTAPVRVVIEATDPSEAVLVGPNTFDFSADDWNMYQQVTVRGVNDDDLDYRIDSQVRVVSVTTTDPWFRPTSAARVTVRTYDEEYIQEFEGEEYLDCYQRSCELSVDGRYLLAVRRAPGCDNVPAYYDRFTALTYEVVRPPGGVCPSGDVTTIFGQRMAGRPTRIAFDSFASNWIASDTNDTSDVFFYDDETDTLELVSVALGGGVANGESKLESVSDDGRYVVFTSAATNLVTNDDTNGVPDLFLRDRVLGTTTLISQNASGDAGDSSSGYATILRDGSRIYFDSTARDLTLEGRTGIFEYTLATDSLRWVDVGTTSGGFYSAQAASRGRVPASDVIVYTGYAGDFVDGVQPVGLWATKVSSGSTTLATRGGRMVFDTAFGWSVGSFSVSDDGESVAFMAIVPTGPGGEERWEIFLANRTLGDPRQLSLRPDGMQPNAVTQHPLLSGDGAWALIESNATDLTPRGRESGLFIANLADY